MVQSSSSSSSSSSRHNLLVKDLLKQKGNGSWFTLLRHLARQGSYRYRIRIAGTSRILEPNHHLVQDRRERIIYILLLLLRLTTRDSYVSRAHSRYGLLVVGVENIQQKFLAEYRREMDHRSPFYFFIISPKEGSSRNRATEMCY